MKRRLVSALLLSILVVPFAWTQDATSTPKQVPSDTVQGLLIRKVAPVYPPLARQARIQGTVILRATIDKTGSVANLQLISGHPMLAPAAIEAVKEWKYQPYTIEGQPVEVQTDVQVNFTLADQPMTGVIGSVVGGYNLPPATPGVPRAPEAVTRTLRIEKVDPLYPPIGIRDRIQGSVFLDVRIAASGDVENVSMISGHPVLAPAAIEAVRQWKYKPYMVNGEPGLVETTVSLTFTISDSDPQGSVSEAAPLPRFPDVPAVTRPQRVRVSAGVAQGLLVKKISPVYPPDARSQHIQGTVVLHALIDKQGNISSIDVISGDETLAESAIEAVRQWKYRPYLLNGEPVEVDTHIQVNFTLAP